MRLFRLCAPSQPAFLPDGDSIVLKDGHPSSERCTYTKRSTRTEVRVGQTVPFVPCVCRPHYSYLLFLILISSSKLPALRPPPIPATISGLRRFPSHFRIRILNTRESLRKALDYGEMWGGAGRLSNVSQRLTHRSLPLRELHGCKEISMLSLY